MFDHGIYKRIKILLQTLVKVHASCSIFVPAHSNHRFHTSNILKILITTTQRTIVKSQATAKEPLHNINSEIDWHYKKP